MIHAAWSLNPIISFQEKEGDVFNFLRERIRMGKGYLNKMGPTT
jgi:hypothetical protein